MKVTYEKEFWERFRRLLDGYHLSSKRQSVKTDKCRSTQAQKHVIFCPLCTKGSRFCIVVTGDEKWIYFEDPKRKNHGKAQAHHPHRPHDRIASAERRCAVFGGTRGVWSIMSCYIQGKRLILNVINNNWLIWTVSCLKKGQNTERGNTKSFFFTTMLRGSRTCCAVLCFVRRCEKMARWVVRSKRGRFLLTWYSQIARKMGEMYNKRWSVLWIKYFCPSSEFNVFWERKSAFHTCTSGMKWSTFQVKLFPRQLCNHHRQITCLSPVLIFGDAPIRN